MTQPTHDEVIAWIYERVDGDNPALGSFRASLLANRDVLERHKEVVHYKLPTREQRKAGMDYQDPSLAYSQCTCGYVETFTAGDGELSTAIGTNKFPCPTYLDILQRIAEVM